MVGVPQMWRDPLLQDLHQRGFHVLIVVSNIETDHSLAIQVRSKLRRRHSPLSTRIEPRGCHINPRPDREYLLRWGVRNKGSNACVRRVTTDGHPGLGRSRTAQPAKQILSMLLNAHQSAPPMNRAGRAVCSMSSRRRTPSPWRAAAYGRHKRGPGTSKGVRSSHRARAPATGVPAC
jgi:hypothetical protein